MKHKQRSFSDFRENHFHRRLFCVIQENAHENGSPRLHGYVRLYISMNVHAHNVYASMQACIFYINVCRHVCV